MAPGQRTKQPAAMETTVGGCQGCALAGGRRGRRAPEYMYCEKCSSKRLGEQWSRRQQLQDELLDLREQVMSSGDAKCALLFFSLCFVCAVHHDSTRDHPTLRLATTTATTAATITAAAITAAAITANPQVVAALKAQNASRELEGKLAMRSMQVGNRNQFHASNPRFHHHYLFKPGDE